GIGQQARDEIPRDDFPVVQAVVMMIAVNNIVLTLLDDVLNALLDQRSRLK
ncbi:ABC transporter permease, partial [Pseudomonas syringae pv. tagetis]